MCDSIVHRGPDDVGLFVEGRCGLGVRRLSIIDLDGGHQPVFNESGTSAIVLNGEIYNYRDLRRDLAAQVCAIHVLKGRNLKAAEQGKPSRWPPGFNTGKMYYCPIERPIDEQLDWLAEIEPAYLLTYPSNLLGLLRKSRETGARVPGLAQVCTMGEVLDAHVRETCEREWGVPVIDLYSSQEVGVIASQCP